MAVPNDSDLRKFAQSFVERCDRVASIPDADIAWPLGMPESLSKAYVMANMYVSVVVSRQEFAEAYTKYEYYNGGTWEKNWQHVGEVLERVLNSWEK
jgi:hypothetical protein